jgi:hypothetical protein
MKGNGHGASPARGIIRGLTLRRLLAAHPLLLLVCVLAATGAGKAAPLPAPSFSVPGGVFTNDFTLELSTTVATGTIRYTLDGSEPAAAAENYSKPISITHSTVIRARVFAPGQPAGELAVQSYVRLEPDVIGFNSSLPLVLIHTFGQDISKDRKLAVSTRIIDPRGGRATMLGGANFDGRALINLRGRASLRYPKRSYTVKTVDANEDMATFSILGLPKDADWVLYAPYPDKTLMRDVLAYELSRQLGRWAPRTRFVELFLNERGGNISRRDYLGVYVFVERVKRGKHRVNIANLDPDDNAEPLLTGGYLFKKDHGDNGDAGPMWGPGPAFQAASAPNKRGFPTGPGSFPGAREGFQPSYQGLPPTSSSSSSSRSSRNANAIVTNRVGTPTPRASSSATRTVIRYDDGDEVELAEDNELAEYFRSSRTNKFFYAEPEPDEITAVQRAWLRHHVNQFEAALYGPDFKDPDQGYTAFIDADSFIDYHLLVETTKNVDGFRFSTFYHKDRGGKIQMGPLWDWNLSFGNCNGKQGYLAEWWLWPQLDDKEYSWFRRLFEDPDFGQKYVDRWTELRRGALATSNLLARVDELAALLDEAQARNFERWPILGAAINPNWFAGDTYAEEVRWMKEWMTHRLAWIEKQFVPPPSISVADGGKLALAAPRGRIFYTLDGTDPRAPGGAVSAKAARYDSPMAVPAGKTVFVRALQEKRWSGPLIWP